MTVADPFAVPDRAPATTEPVLEAVAEPEAVPETPPGRPLLTPADGVPDVVDTPAALVEAAARLAAGHGPVAIDAERASGFRYSNRAYLVQLRREGSGTVMVDPIPLTTVNPLVDALEGTEWILHAASQDLACLAELGLRPTTLFDTELAGRLAGYERVGLGAMIERLLGWTLAKEHSAADWSTRPLPEPWLRYAALDVELLVELREALDADLTEQGKREWAAQEFAHLARMPAPAPRVDPWRRVSGTQRLRRPRQLAAVREMWLARDQIARTKDVAPGRVLRDDALVAAVNAWPTTLEALQALPVFGGPKMRRTSATWLGALTRAAALPDGELPPSTLPSDGPPPASRWAEKDPAAGARLVAARTALQTLSDELRLPVENMCEPALVRRVLWERPDDARAALAAGNARPWQVELVAPVVEGAWETSQEP